MDREYLAERTSEAFAQVIAKAVEIDPKKRFQNAFEMFLAFQNVAKKDWRYQALLRRQKAVRFGLLIGNGRMSRHWWLWHLSNPGGTGDRI